MKYSKNHDDQKYSGDIDSPNLGVIQTNAKKLVLLVRFLLTGARKN